MALTVSNWAVYDLLDYKLGLKQINLSSDAFKIALFTSSSNCGTASLSPATYAALTNEVANGNGYTTGGVALSSVTWTNSSGNETFTSNSVSWSASGADIVARYAVLYDSTTGDLLQVCTFGNNGTPADVTIPNGGPPLTLQPAGTGWFKLNKG